MRSAVIATAALAVGALAVPYQKEKRAMDIVTDVDYETVYTTVFQTVTGAAPAPAAPSAENKQRVQHGGPPHRHHWWQHPNPPHQPTAPTTTEAPQPPPTSSAPSSESQAPAPTGGSGGGSQPMPSSAGSSYSDIAVYHHNLHRKNHSASDIAWDQGLADIAGDIAKTCVYAHNVNMGGGGYGQNIAAGVESNNISAIITNLFYNGEVNYYEGLYGQAQPSMANFEQWGHFSQIVWKDTTHVGCATQDCSGQGLANVGGDVSPFFTVCNYKSPGNFANEYGQNVGEPLGEPTASWDTGLS